MHFLLLLINVSLLYVVSDEFDIRQPQIIRLLREIDDAQNPISCDNKRYILFQYSEEDEVNGFAAMYHFAMSSLALANALNRTLIEVFPDVNRFDREGYGEEFDPWNRAAPGYCGIQKIGCFFKPLSKCAAFDFPIKTFPILDPIATEDILMSKLLKVPPSPTTLEHFEHEVLRLDKIERFNSIFLDITRGDYAPYWFRTYNGWRKDYFPTFITWHFRPQQRIMNMTNPVITQLSLFRTKRSQSLMRLQQSGFTEEIAQLLPPPPPALTIHIRRGDTRHLSWRFQGTFELYAHQAEVLKDVYIQRMQVWTLTYKKYLDSENYSRFIGRGAHNITNPSAFSFLRREIADLESLFYSRWPVFIATDSETIRREARQYFANHKTYRLLEYPVKILSGVEHGENTHNVESVIRATNFELQRKRGSSRTSLSNIETQFAANNMLFFPSKLTSEEVGKTQNPKTLTNAPARLLSQIVSSKPFRPKEKILTPENLAKMDTLSLRAVRELKDSETELYHGSDMNPLLLELVSLLDSVIADTWILAHGDHFIGTCLSQISRIAVELMQTNGRQKAILAMDNQMCRQYPRHFYSITQDWQGDWSLFVSQ